MKKIIFLILFILLIYTRFVNIDWGFPYPFHPDERNMAVSLQQLNCKEFPISNFQFPKLECLNPHFFAYGQLPLYLGYFFIQVFHLLTGQFGQAISFNEATIVLRLISAVASVINVFILLKIINLFYRDRSLSSRPIPTLSRESGGIPLNTRERDSSPTLLVGVRLKHRTAPLGMTGSWSLIIILLLLTFSPALIQFAHFGTTESLLMLFYSLIIYESLRSLDGRPKIVHIFLLGLWAGLAIATKISSVVFLAVPLIAIFLNSNWKDAIADKFYLGTKFLITPILIGIIFSPYNIISLPDFLGSMSYESAVATGGYIAFYTRQFLQTMPVVFQTTNIFPYALGWPIFILFFFGFIFFPWRKEINLLRMAIVVYFIPNAFFFAKWTRFMAPILPLMIVFAILILFFVFTGMTRKARMALISIIIILSILPGVTYLSIYQNPDVRFAASNWIYKNIPNNSVILSETANVVDLPIISPDLKKTISNQQLAISNYQIISFNFYDLDENKILQEDLENNLSKADYIFVPSRRIFANHTCQLSSRPSEARGGIPLNTRERDFLGTGRDDSRDDARNDKCSYLKQKYSHINNYYEKLFSGKLGFKEVQEFNSYPKISLFGKTLLEFPDEGAEETWTVFDHPVIRIYKKTSKLITNP